MNTSWQKIAVIGAAGKMGRGIALLLLQEMAREEAELTGSIGKGTYQLQLIDSDENSLYALRTYFRAQLVSYAEKNIVALRNYFKKSPALVSNTEIINAFVGGAMSIPRYSTDTSKTKECTFIFEAIVEDLDTKVKLFHSLKEICGSEAYFFTNTSSIPISLLNNRAELKNRIIGFHFYNPPPIQKLVELITYEGINPKLVEFAHEIAKRLRKTVVPANDKAGFIGNGHFLREVLFACKLVQELSQTRSRTEAIYIINKVTQDYLLRPMGIFQLIDYVGIDVCQKIAQIMRAYLPDPRFHTELLEEYLQAGFRGGQNNDGSQKDGFFRYHRSEPIAFYSLEEKTYKPLEEFKILDNSLSPSPEFSWKVLLKDPMKEKKIQYHFNKLRQTNTLGSQLAQRFLEHSRTVGQELVKKGIAKSIEDVSTVLQDGFYHLYGTKV